MNNKLLKRAKEIYYQDTNVLNIDVVIDIMMKFARECC